MKKVLVRGPALSRSGYGEHARFVLRALRSREDIFDIYLININWGKTGWIYEDTEERKWIDKIILKTTLAQQQKSLHCDMSLQITIPNEWEDVAPVNIGVTAGIETTKVSPAWVEKSFIMDKIITVSEHSKLTYQNTSYQATNKETGNVINDFRCRIPVEVVHYPVKHFEPAPLDFNFDTDFNFLVVAQWSVRKNLENTIKWFVEEFFDQKVGLVLKINTMNNSILDRAHTTKRLKQLLSEYKNKKCKIYLLHGDMDERELTTLYQHSQIKALISLAHGEGFGLPIFEAAYNELPIIATNWSGHLDFLYVPYKNKKGKLRNKAHFVKIDYDISPVQKEAIWKGVIEEDSMWAYAKQGSYKMKLREVYKDYGRFKSQAKKLQKWILDNFSEEQQYKKFIDEILMGEEFVPNEEIDRLFDDLTSNEV